MSQFKRIRSVLGVKQQEIAVALGCSQANIVFLERGQTVTPDTAGRLIAYAATLGVTLTYDQVYGAQPLPMPRRLAPAQP